MSTATTAARLSPATAAKSTADSSAISPYLPIYSGLFQAQYRLCRGTDGVRFVPVDCLHSAYSWAQTPTIPRVIAATFVLFFSGGVVSVSAKTFCSAEMVENHSFSRLQNFLHIRYVNL